MFHTKIFKLCVNGLALGEGGGFGADYLRAGRKPDAGKEDGTDRSPPLLLSAC
jgi:hypothetical protein